LGATWGAPTAAGRTLAVKAYVAEIPIMVIPARATTLVIPVEVLNQDCPIKIPAQKMQLCQCFQKTFGIEIFV